MSSTITFGRAEKRSVCCYAGVSHPAICLSTGGWGMPKAIARQAVNVIVFLACFILLPQAVHDLPGIFQLANKALLGRVSVKARKRKLLNAAQHGSGMLLLLDHVFTNVNMQCVSQVWQSQCICAGNNITSKSTVS